MVTLARRRRPFLSATGLSVSVDSRNLICRAYELLKRECPATPALRVYLKKRIPVASGMGGGSSDAGTFLYGVNEKFKLGLSQKKLTALAGRLGADVPFFVANKSTALGFGRGDRLRYIPRMGGLWFTIICFPSGLSTKNIYKYYNNLRTKAHGLTKAKHDATILCNYLRQKDLSQVGMYLRNDLRASSEALKPAAWRVLNFLRENRVKAASVTGSGPTCFVISPSRAMAERVARRVQQRFGLKTFVSCSY